MAKLVVDIDGWLLYEAELLLRRLQDINMLADVDVKRVCELLTLITDAKPLSYPAVSSSVVQLY